MRVKLSLKNLQRLFQEVLKKTKRQEDVALNLGVSVRTLNDWGRGKSTIPLNSFKKLVLISDSEEKLFSPRLLSDFWHVKDAAKKGAHERMRLYGNFGTAEGRRKGGLASIKSQGVNRRFKTLKPITIPRSSEELAELLGILIGDGHLSRYQVGITTNSKTDYEHAIFSSKLIRKLFGVSPTIKKRGGENAVNIVASSRNMVKFLHKKGMPVGNKIQNKLSIPAWIFRKTTYRRAFLRGLFDTDGCVYIDTHKTNKKIYRHLGWTITSYADKLITDVIEVLKGFNFSPTHKNSQKSVYLRRQKEIVRYFQEVGTSNLKHRKRFKKFIGGVPKWS